jgi:PIN domain nuclease of toxin-antitoxin system
VRLLLDTHVFLAFAARRLHVLPRAIRRAMDESEAPIHVSATSLWEISIKHGLGKLTLDGTPADLVTLAGEAGFSLLPVTPLHAVTVVTPEPATRDPFDRMLLAQCLVEGLRLATIDRALADHPLSAVT